MTSVRGDSRLRLVVLAALAVCLSSGLANAQSHKAKAGATRGSAATLFAWNYSLASNAVGLSTKYLPPDPCRSTPPDPCSPWEQVKSVLRRIQALF